MTTPVDTASEPEGGGQERCALRGGRPDTRRKACHVVLPALMPALFYLVAATPVETLGCVTRGLLALLVAFVSALAALGAAIIATAGRRRRDVLAPWWVISSVILAIPVVALIILA